MRGNIQQLLRQFSRIAFGLAQTAPQRVVMMQKIFNTGLQMFRIGQIADANSAARDFVFIGGANAALGRSYFHAVHAVLANAVQL